MGQVAGTLEDSHSRPFLVATIAGSFLVRLGGAATGVMLGLMLAHLHRTGAAQSSAMAASLLFGVFYLSELLGAPIAGFLIDRRGVRALLLAGPILGIAAEGLFATPTHLGLLTVARLLQGLTTACTIPAALAFLSNITSGGASGRGKTMGFFEVGSIGGLAFGSVAGGFLWDWLHRPGFWTLMIVYGLAVALFVFIHAEAARRAVRPPRASWRAIRGAADLMPSWLAVTAVAGLWFGQAAYQFSGANPRLHQQLTVGLSGSAIGIVFGVYTLLFAVGTVGWGWLLGRVSLGQAMKVGVAGLMIAAVSLLGINHAGRYGGAWFIVSVVVGVGALAAQTAFTPAALTLLAVRSDADRDSRGAVMGVYSMLLAGGQLVGTILGGVFAQFWGVDGLIAATVILGVLAAATLPRDTTATGLLSTAPQRWEPDARPALPNP